MRSTIVALAPALLATCSAPPRGGLAPTAPALGATSGSSAAATGCTDVGPAGVAKQMVTPIHAASGPEIDAPVVCDRAGAPRGWYIAVHGHGKRPIALGSETPHGCPEPPRTADGCVLVDRLGEAIIARLGGRGITTVGYGLGVCGNTSSGLAGWRMSIGIDNWKDADAAIAAVDEELRARDVAGTFGVSVRGIPCSTPELSPEHPRDTTGLPAASD